LPQQTKGGSVEKDEKLAIFIRFIRFPIVALAAAAMTISLFYLMQSLIASNKQALDESPVFNIVDFTRVRQVQEVQTTKRRAEPPPVPDVPPPPLQIAVSTTKSATDWSNTFTPPPSKVDVDLTIGLFSDGERLPVVKVQPIYPQRALERGLIGWVIVEFTVDEIGRVINPVVVDNCVTPLVADHTECTDHPGRMFDRSALRAASKFKYKPLVVDGIAMASPGVRNRITFELGDNE